MWLPGDDGMALGILVAVGFSAFLSLWLMYWFDKLKR